MAQHTGSIGIDTVTLVAIFVEAVLYGANDSLLFVLAMSLIRLIIHGQVFCLFCPSPRQWSWFDNQDSPRIRSTSQWSSLWSPCLFWVPSWVSLHSQCIEANHTSNRGVTFFSTLPPTYRGYWTLSSVIPPTSREDRKDILVDWILLCMSLKVAHMGYKRS